jgi:hypothetical protein
MEDRAIKGMFESKMMTGYQDHQARVYTWVPTGIAHATPEFLLVSPQSLVKDQWLHRRVQA